MKTLDISAYGVEEMNKQEMMQADGGVLPIVAGILLVAYLTGMTTAVYHGYNPHGGHGKTL